MSATLAADRRILRHSRWDALLVSLSVAHAAVLLAAPSIPAIAVLLWWNANTVAHNFIHTPFFRARALNTGYSIYLSAVLGIPQSLWRRRHLHHHAELQPGSGPSGSTAGRHAAVDRDRLLPAEIAVVAGLWAAMAVLAPAFFAFVYLPGYLIGLGLCALQGHYEHARGTTSHYGWIYNACFFNDGYHVEHHRFPGRHWTELPQRAIADAQQSRWPPVLRWLDVISLETLERIVVHVPVLQRFVLAVHRRALATMLAEIAPVARVTVVGGGLYPRTAILLRELLPGAALTIVERRAEHIEIARGFLTGPVTFQHAIYDPAAPDGADLVILPLAFAGDRRAVYHSAPARWTLVHDWIWKRTSPGVPVSWLLLKRLNLVTR
jgi:Fatty acid desaturase